MSIQVKIFGTNFKQEKEYIFQILFNEFFIVDYTLEWIDSTDNFYHIVFPNNVRMEIKDHFFSQSNTKLKPPYCYPLPKDTGDIRYTSKYNHPYSVLYGSHHIQIEKKSIHVDIDIVGGFFFLLTRWEEAVIPTKDNFGRFDTNHSVIVKNKLHKFPLINEWMALMNDLLEEVGVSPLKKRQIYQLIPTHDIDVLDYPSDILTIAGDVVHTKSLLPAFKRLKSKWNNDNPNNTFDWLMDCAEKNNLKARFYFMSNGSHPLDNKYTLDHKLVEKTFDKIKNREHIIGFHPGLETAQNENEFKKQLNHLKKTANIEINEGRQHFLKFSNPTTWNIWNNCSMNVDSTLGYTLHSGFRCGTAYEFTVFDVYKRQTLHLKERPLIAMDVNFHNPKYQKQSLTNARIELDELKDTCKKYEMPFTINFHNNNFEPVRWNGWKELYQDLLNS